MTPVKLISVLVVSSACAWAAPNDPGKTALEFIEKVRDKKLNLEPGTDTALTPQTTEQKRKEIARRLERMAGDLDHSTLEIGAVKTDGDLAAVLIRKFHGFNSQRLAVFPVALVKRGVDWMAAPVPASFENSGAGYHAGIRPRLAALETWMLREQASDLELLRSETSQRMRRKIEDSLSEADLRALDSRQAAERFVTACEQRDVPELLGLMGGLEPEMPGDWTLRLNAVEEALGKATRTLTRPWRLLAAPEVLRVPLFHDGEDETAYLVLACLDPKGFPNQASLPQIELIRLNLTRSSSKTWRVDPPRAFTQGDDEVDFVAEDSSDSRLLALFPSKTALKYPPESESTAEKAIESLYAALASPRPDSWVRLVKFNGETDEICGNFGKTAAIWWQASDPANPRIAIPLDFHEQDDMAVSACQFFDSRHPDQFDLQYFYFEKTQIGWVWNPVAARSKFKPLDEWIGGQPQKWQERWQERMLSDNQLIEDFSADAPIDDEARKLVATWCEVSRRADLKSAIRLTARMKTPDSAVHALRILGYEFSGSAAARQTPTVSFIKRGARITAVGVKSCTSDGKPLFPLYPVVTTASGPRILLEVDLAASNSRTREYLNEVSLKRLRKISPEVADEMQQLYSDFRKEVASNSLE